MCLAIPLKVTSVVDAEQWSVIVEGRDGQDEINAAMMADAVDTPEQLLGRWVVAQTGFAIMLLEDEDARSRLAVFDALASLNMDEEALRPPPNP